MWWLQVVLQWCNLKLDGRCDLGLPLTDRSSDCGRPRYCLSSSSTVERSGYGDYDLYSPFVWSGGLPMCLRLAEETVA